MSGMADNEEFITPKRNGNVLQFATPKNTYMLCYYEIHDLKFIFIEMLDNI